MQSNDAPASHLTKLTRSELFLLIILACVQFTHIMDFMIMMPLGPQLMRLFDISPRQFGFIVSSYTLTAGATGFIGAFFIDRFDRKKALLTAYTGFAIGTFACALAPTYEFLLAARSLAGAFGGILGALIFSIIGDAIHGTKRGRAMGIVMGSFSMASVFGVPFGLFLANLYSWHAPFVFVAGIAAINLAVAMFYLPSMTKHIHAKADRPSPIQLLKHIANDSNQLRALAFMFLLMFSQFSMIPFLSPSMVANVGFKETQLPYIYLFGGGMTIFTSPIVGRLADRYGKSRIFTISALLVLIPYYVVTHLGPSPIWVALIATTAFFIFGNGRFVPAMAMVTSTVKPETRGGFMSINSSVQSLASSLAAFSSGLIVAKGADGQLLNYGLVGNISIAISLVGIWMGRKLKARD